MSTTVYPDSDSPHKFKRISIITAGRVDCYTVETFNGKYAMVTDVNGNAHQAARTDLAIQAAACALHHEYCGQRRDGRTGREIHTESQRARIALMEKYPEAKTPSQAHAMAMAEYLAALPVAGK